MEFRKGDRVSIEGVVKYDVSGDGGTYVFFNTDEGDDFSARAQFIKVVSRALRQDDAVEVVPGIHPYLIGKIFALYGEWAWVLAESGYMASYRLDQLRRRETHEPIGETFVDGLRVDPPKPQPQAKGEVPAPSVGTVEYTTVEGDTLLGIANTFETSVDTIAIANDIADPDLIIAGQVLKITDNRIPF